MSEVRSLTSPASTCCFSTPPPQVWKMSGSFPEDVRAVILDLYASFSRVTSLTLTLGFWAMNALAASIHCVLDGSVVEMFHHSTVTLPPEELLPPPPQALRSGAVRPATAVADRKLRRERDCSPIGGLLRMGWTAPDTFRKVSGTPLC